MSDFHANIHQLKRVLEPSKVLYVNWTTVDLLEDCDCVDEMIVVGDPGPLVDRDFVSNINRQIVSVRSGLARISSDFTLKVRSDIRISSGAMVEELGAAHQIRVTNNGFLNPIRTGVLLHIPDVIQFGRTKLLQQIWDRPTFANWDLFPDDIQNRKLKLRHLRGLRQALTTEQLIAKRWFEATSTPNATFFSTPEVRGFQARLAAWKWVMSRVVILNHSNSGVHMPPGLTASWISKWRLMPSNPENYSTLRLRLEFMFFIWSGALMPDVIASRLRSAAERLGKGES